MRSRDVEESSRGAQEHTRADPLELNRDQCLAARFDALQGQSELPFTVSAVQVLGFDGATPVTAGYC